MKFGPIELDRAAGCILAHSVSLPELRLRKGHILTRSECEAMQGAGQLEITVARLEPGDILENEAAKEVANLLATKTVQPAEAFTGRVNLHADRTGLFTADTLLVDKINRIHPGVTIATLADDSVVEAGRMVATVKIIPFAVPRAAIDAVALIVGDGEAINLLPFRPLKIALVQTELPILKSSVYAKTEKVLEERLGKLSCQLVSKTRCAHEAAELSAELREAQSMADMTIVFGASAIADKDDVIPSAIGQAGGTVSRFGMPVDPGNLLLVGDLYDKPVIGAPGCARSSAENGFDWVLRRLVAGRTVDGDYISGLGVGGLLMEIHSRPQPRDDSK